MPEEWVKQEVLDIRKVEEKELFDSLHDQWQELKNAVESGGNLHEYSTDALSWSMCCGRSGYCVVKDGKVVCSMWTKMN